MSVGHRLDGPADAPIVVLSNSLGTTYALWDAQLPGLLERFRVLRYDHPCHGRSEIQPGLRTVEAFADNLLPLLDRLELERVSFCGLSLGGMVGMALALRAPKRVDRLVLCSTAAYLGPPEGWLERARLVRAEGTSSIAESVLGRWFTEEFRNERPATVAHFREQLEATPRDGYAACCEAIATWDARDRIGTIAAPTLVVVGAEDPATTTKHAELIAAGIPGARLEVIPDGAHLVNVEQPDAFDWALLEHLDAHPSSEEAA